MEKNDGCSSFRATDIRVQRNKPAILEERGIFVLLCAKHEIPLRCVDMYTGERFDYADHLVAEHLSSGYGGTKLHLFYDVACKYHKNIKVSSIYVSLHVFTGVIETVLGKFRCCIG